LKLILFFQNVSVTALKYDNLTSNEIANTLTDYVKSITDSDTPSDANNVLSIADIEMNIDKINTNFTTDDSNDAVFFMVRPISEADHNETITLGASFSTVNKGEIITNNNKDNAINKPLSAAAIIANDSIVGVTRLKIFIINEPVLYKNIDNHTNKTVASSIIVASVTRNNSQLQSPMNISLFFQIIPALKPNITNVDYYCSFYDTNTSQWSESGCTKPRYNSQWDRYECSCNHLTSFALIWLPNTQYTQNLSAQDIASLVFQSISIICFIIVISHALCIRLRDPLMRLQAYDLLPLISFASTTILFIFFIALGMTVYTKTTSEEQTECFLSSSVLMFFVYFFVIFMFCTKTSVGYFNYLRFVLLFPQPRARKLIGMLIISFFISITWVSFAAGFNSNPSYNITQLYPYKLCWFSRPALYYFLTIPVGIFILVNIILFIAIAYRIINHVRYATSRHQTFERMKRCVLVLLSSCLTQGIGWLFGPVLSLVDPTAGEVLGWFFIVFNGLEGLWSLLLYVIIRSQRMDEQKRVSAIRDLTESTITSSRIRHRSASFNTNNSTYSVRKNHLVD